MAGEFADIQFPLPKDIDPAFWKPKPKDILPFQQADLILLNGATYSKWLETVSIPESRTVNTSSPFSNRLIKIEKSFVHRHGPDGDHSHGGIAYTTWLDLNQARMQAGEVKSSLVELLPEREKEIVANFESLGSDLKKLDESFLKTGKQLESVPLMMSHPIYQYFSRRYHLDTVSVLWEPDVVPDEKSLSDLAEKLKDHSAKIMIWEAEPEEQTQKLLKEKFGIECVVVDPRFNVGESGMDWMATMKKNLAAMESIVNSIK